MSSTHSAEPDFSLLLRSLDRGTPNIGARTLGPDLARAAQRAVRDWRPRQGDNFSPQETRFQVIDFFCGCGGMSLGFAALSRVLPAFEIVGGCDINADALTTFSANFAAPGIQTDIRELVGNSEALKRFLSQMPRYREGRPTILIGCAPCQGFTSHRKRNWHNIDQRNTLVGAFADIAVRLAPECIVMENVPEFLGKKYWDHFDEARTSLESAGYHVNQSIYNAATFGVPQERFRALVVAMKKPFVLPAPQFIDPAKFKTVRHAIGRLPQVAPGAVHPRDTMHRSAAHRESTLQTIRLVPKDGGSRPSGVGPQCLDRVQGFYDVYGRLAWDRPAITITHYARNPASGRYTHPEQDRGLTMREAANLQSFPKGFKFCGSFDSVFKQIGEAVPPRFAAAVAASCAIELGAVAPSPGELEHAIPSVTEPVSSSFSSVIAGMKMARKSR